MFEQNFLELPVGNGSRLLLLNLPGYQTGQNQQQLYHIRNHTEIFLVNIVRRFESCNMVCLKKFINESLKEIKILYQFFNRAKIIDYFPKIMIGKIKAGSWLTEN